MRADTDPGSGQAPLQLCMHRTAQNWEPTGLSAIQRRGPTLISGTSSTKKAILLNLEISSLVFKV